MKASQTGILHLSGWCRGQAQRLMTRASMSSIAQKRRQTGRRLLQGQRASPITGRSTPSTFLTQTGPQRTCQGALRSRPTRTPCWKKVSAYLHIHLRSLEHGLPSQEEPLKILDPHGSTATLCLSILHACMSALLGRQCCTCRPQMRGKSAVL